VNAIVLPDPTPEDVAFVDGAPHRVQTPDGDVRTLDRTARKRWRTALTGDLLELLT
jgi:hypothetical protein